MFSADRRTGSRESPDAAAIDPPKAAGRSSLTQDMDGGDSGGRAAGDAPMFGGDEQWEILAGDGGGAAGGGGGGGVSLSLDESLSLAGLGGEEAGGGDDDATEVAEAGFRGAGGDVPHRAEMEKSFGTSFAGVKAHTDEHAQEAADGLGAKAYASGNRVAFRSANPDRSLVAHELTHVLQHTGRSPATKGADGSGGVDTSGEPEAERVEAAVAAGKPARSALDGRDGDRRPAAAPATALKKRPALAKSDFGTGMTFSPSGLEKEGTYTIWDTRNPIEIPVGAVPGLNIMVSPAVQAKVAAGVNLRKKALTTRVGVDGEVGVGFSYGNTKIAALYGQMAATIGGGFTYERQKRRKKIANWDLTGSMSFGTKFAVGVRLGGGVIDSKFEFGQTNIGTLTGLAWHNGRFDKNKIGWDWGPGPEWFFRQIRTVIDKVKKIINLPKDKIKDAWRGMKGVINGLGGVVKKIKIPDITPWDGLAPW